MRDPSPLTVRRSFHTPITLDPKRRPHMLSHRLTEFFLTPDALARDPFHHRPKHRFRIDAHFLERLPRNERIVIFQFIVAVLAAVRDDPGGGDLAASEMLVAGRVDHVVC